MQVPQFGCRYLSQLVAHNPDVGSIGDDLNSPSSRIRPRKESVAGQQLRHGAVDIHYKYVRSVKRYTLWRGANGIRAYNGAGTRQKVLSRYR